MNIFLSILQVLLAIHTIIGALWKWSNPEQTIPSLNVLPHGLWVTLSVLEIAAALLLLWPIMAKHRNSLVPWACLFIIAEMLLYIMVHIMSGDQNFGPVFYWLTVIAICALLAYGRWKLISTTAQK